MEIRLDKQPLRFVHFVNQLIGCHVRRWRETRVFKQKYIYIVVHGNSSSRHHTSLPSNPLFICVSLQWFRLSDIQLVSWAIKYMEFSHWPCAAAPREVTSRGRLPGTYCMVGWVCLTSSACTAEKREVPYFCGESTDDLSLKPVTQWAWGYLTGRTDKNPENSCLQ